MATSVLLDISIIRIAADAPHGIFKDLPYDCDSSLALAQRLSRWLAPPRIHPPVGLAWRAIRLIAMRVRCGTYRQP